MGDNVRFDLGTNPTDVTIEALALLLNKITTANDHLIANETTKQEHTSTHRRNSQVGCTCFHARTIPSIDIKSYLLRINRYCPAKNEVFLSLLVYFDRMSQSSLHMRIDSFNIHRLVISGVTVASKLFSDTFFTNTRYAKVGGLPIAELNNLELEFLHLNNFDLYISIEELQEYGDQLMKHWYQHESGLNNTEPSTADIPTPVKRKLSQPNQTDEDQNEKDSDTILKSDTRRMRQLSIDNGTGTGRRRSSSASHTMASTQPAGSLERSTSINMKDPNSTDPKLKEEFKSSTNTEDALFHAANTNRTGLRGSVPQSFT
ncbi:hypothetical protein NQZ79_g532 [Umbelopsis isabellina]|nr:hypothetical protein NQZ79_g532 [Umbelopsis isabellina]